MTRVFARFYRNFDRKYGVNRDGSKKNSDARQKSELSVSALIFVNELEKKRAFRNKIKETLPPVRTQIYRIANRKHKAKPRRTVISSLGLRKREIYTTFHKDEDVDCVFRKMAWRGGGRRLAAGWVGEGDRGRVGQGNKGRGVVAGRMQLSADTLQRSS